MLRARPDYLSYLLRLWRDGETVCWRASLESPGGAEMIMLTSLAELFAFLEEQTGEAAVQRIASQSNQDRS